MDLIVQSLAGESVREHVIALLRSTAPFAALSDKLLGRIAVIATLERVPRGEVIYQVGDPAKDLYVVASGQVRHALGPGAQATVLVKVVGRGDVIGWAALLKDRSRRLAKTTALEESELLKIRGDQLMEVLGDDPVAAQEVLERCAKMIIEDFTVPAWLAQVQVLPTGKAAAGTRAGGASNIRGLALFMHRISKWLQGPTPYLMVVGFALFFGAWYLLSEVFHLWRFASIPGPHQVLIEWLNPNPVYGLSVYSSEYYIHIWSSIRRILIGFTIATAVGVPVGLFLGWSRTFREYVFPVFETLRPIPVLAWVPLAIVMFKSGAETPVIFLATLASFYATALNTMLGVESIDEAYPRAAACLGASKWQIFRHVVIPGALPYIFTGLQISVGVAWFSLVAAEMVSGEYGLGYVINTSYVNVRYPTIVIGMITLGIVGYVTSALVRMAGDYMMQWRVRELALGGRE
ncbi:MAG: ABC transporter permease subunit [Betaproteobacteria bacterium]|nr:MAG: ABC transporter permease subunit [Betaproteobacteria bacterium]